MNGTCGNRDTPKVSELDIYRSATVLIRDHDEDAAIAAAMRADAMLERGDLDGCAVWRRILKAVDELGKTAPEDGEARH